MHTTAQALKCFQLCCDLTSKYCSIDLVTLDQRTGNVIILAKEEINQDLRKSIEICPILGKLEIKVPQNWGI